MTAERDPSASSSAGEGGRLRSVMTLAEKLAAVQDARVGSYNFAPPLGQADDPIFQGLVKRAFNVAVAQGYFHRVERDANNQITSLLVTVSASPQPPPLAA